MSSSSADELSNLSKNVRTSGADARSCALRGSRIVATPSDTLGP
jgi:hypothetical protein